jgi:hypothetical protein
MGVGYARLQSVFLVTSVWPIGTSWARRQAQLRRSEYRTIVLFCQLQPPVVQYDIGAELSKAIRPWIPKVLLQAHTGKNRAHLVRLRTPRILLQPGRIPCGRQCPELVDPHQRPQGTGLGNAPLSNPFFRPEEEHVVSGKDDVVPPFRRRNQAVEEPVRGLRSLEVHV